MFSRTDSIRQSCPQPRRLPDARAQEYVYPHQMERFSETQFASPETVAEILDISVDEVHNLITSGELLAIRIGAHGPWRVEIAHLEQFIADGYVQAQQSRVWNEGALANIYDLADGRLL